MTPAWAQRREALLRDCIVSPDVFTSMVERLGDFVVPYQRVLETGVGQRTQSPRQKIPGITPAGAVLMRPDGFVAWRAREKESGAADTLARALRTALGKA